MYFFIYSLAYSLAGMISNHMIYRDHISQYTTCFPESVLENTSLGAVFTNTLPRVLEVRNPDPWKISRYLGGQYFPIHSLGPARCQIPTLGKSFGPRGVYFPIHPSSQQSTDTFSLASTGALCVMMCCFNFLSIVKAASAVAVALATKSR